MRGAWPQVRLGELLTPVARAEVVDVTKTYRLLGARWYAGGLFVREEKAGHEIEAIRLYQVRPGDFVYNRLFAWKGSFAVAGKEAAGCHVSNEFPCFEVNAERLDAAFLGHYFRRERSWAEALQLSSGATPTSRNRLKEERFLQMALPLPSLEEQQRVVARIADIETLRRLHAEVGTALDALSSAVLDRAFKGEL